MKLAVDQHRLQAHDEIARIREPAVLHGGRGGNVLDDWHARAQLHERTPADATDEFPTPRNSSFPSRSGGPRRPPAKQTDQVAADSLTLTDVRMGSSLDSGRVKQPTSDSAIPTVDTHWSRILYYDLFRTPTGGSTPDPCELAKGDLWSGASDFTISSYLLPRAARALRSFILGKIIVAAMQAAGAFARRAHARHQQHRQARAIYDALRGLDDRTLRDLGFHRSEITSVAAELTGAAENTRVRTLTDGARFSERSSGPHRARARAAVSTSQY